MVQKLNHATRRGQKLSEKTFSPFALTSIRRQSAVPAFAHTTEVKKRVMFCDQRLSPSLFSNDNISSGACCIKRVVMRLFTLSWSTAPSKGRAHEPSVCDLDCIRAMQPFHTLHTRLLPSNLCAAQFCHVQTWWRVLEHWNLCVCATECVNAFRRHFAYYPQKQLSESLDSMTLSE